MKIFCLVSGLILVFASGSSFSNPQDGFPSGFWNGMSDFNRQPPNNLSPPSLPQPVIMSTDQNFAQLMRQNNGQRRNQANKPKQQQTPGESLRQINKTQSNETSNSTVTNSTESIVSDKQQQKSKETLPGENSILGPEGTQYFRTGIALLGAALGNEGCDVKAACLAARFLPQMHARDAILAIGETLVPKEWRRVYDAAKKSATQGQDCDAFTCL